MKSNRIDLLRKIEAFHKTFFVKFYGNNMLVNLIVALFECVVMPVFLVFLFVVIFVMFAMQGVLNSTTRTAAGTFAFVGKLIIIILVIYLLFKYIGLTAIFEKLFNSFV